MTSQSSWRRQLQITSATYSLGWLFAANLVGVWLAALLVWPQLGQLVREWSYGRWMPLHMDWQLYGWCSLPLVGLLMRYFLCPDNGNSPGELHLGFGAWSLALVLEGWLSLRGEVSGKLFLNWAGWGRIAFPVAQMILLSILVTAWAARLRRIRKFDAKQWIQFIFLLVLLSSPIALFITAGRSVYPPIDPESGGATGHSLLASTLGIILIFGLMPRLLEIPVKRSVRELGRFYLVAYIASALVWALIEHGNVSNRHLNQSLGLGVLLAWVPIVIFYYQSFEWSAPIKPWLMAFFAWWGLLTLTGFITFLPGVLDVLKFTNALVAHAHLAMAGMVSALNMIVLASLGTSKDGDPWEDRIAFWLWQGGTLLYVFLMMGEGFREGLDPMVLFSANTITRGIYGLRLWAGGMMLAASVRWIICLWAHRQSRVITVGRALRI